MSKHFFFAIALDTADTFVAVVPLTEVMQSPHAFDGRTLSVRGFLYRAADGRLILSTEPGLKTCCVGSATRANQQMEVFGDVAAGVSVGMAQILHGRIEVTTSSGISLHDASIGLESTLTSCPLCLASLLLLLGIVIAATLYWIVRHVACFSLRALLLF